MNEKYKKYRIVDVDAHYHDNPRAVHKYLTEPWKTRIRDWSGKYYAPVGGGAVGDPLMGGRVRIGKHNNDMSKRTQGIASTQESILETMEFLEFETIVMIPTYMLSTGKINDKDRAVALANGHADYMLEEIVNPEKGIYCALPVPAQAPDEARKLIERVGNEPGFCAILFVTQGPIPPLGDRKYDPIYEAAERYNLPCILHSGFSGPDSNIYATGLEKWAESHSLDFVFSNMIQLTSIVMQGVKERFPKLDIIFQEAGIFYIPQMMYRLDNEYMRRRAEVPLLKKLPSEYIKDFYYGTQPLELPPNMQHLKMAFDMIDAPNTLMYASDYPHYDWDHPSCITNLTFLSEEDKYKILGENARRVMRFKYHSAEKEKEKANAKS